MITREELKNDLTTFLDGFKGQACSYKHWDLSGEICKHTRELLSKDFDTSTDNNDIYLMYKGFNILRVELKRKKFATFRHYYEAQFYYNDFILHDCYFKEGEELQETINQIDATISKDLQDKEAKKEQAKNILRDVMQAYNLSEYEARNICRVAACTYLNF